MKKLIIMLLLAVMSLNVCTQTYTVKGNTYTSIKKSSRVEGKKTPYFYTCPDGVDRPVYIRTDGRCYCLRVSGTTGKEYKYFIPEDVAKDIAKKCNIQCTYVKKSKKKS